MIDFFGRRFRAWNNIDRSYEAGIDQQPPQDWSCMRREATLVTSKIENSDLHALVIDLDGAHHYEPSSTPGHGHLYLNKSLNWAACLEILDVLQRHGIVERGYYNAARANGYSAVRTPWTRKRGT